MLFEHLSQNKVNEFHDVHQSLQRYHKPLGLWCSLPGKWAEFALPPHSWVATVDINDDFITDWNLHSANQGGVLKLDLSNENDLMAFIDAYRADDTLYDIDWIKVKECYQGIFFTNVDQVPLYFDKFNQRDGCWVNSISVDSLCIWITSALGRVTWRKKAPTRRLAQRS